MSKRKRAPSSSRKNPTTENVPELPDEYKERLQTILDSVSDSCGSMSVKKLKKAIESELGVYPLQSNDLVSCQESDDPTLALERLVAVVWDRNQRADRCFDLLDTDEKGVIVLQDLQRFAEEMLGEDVTTEDLVEMLVEFERDGIITRREFYRIASLVGL